MAPLLEITTQLLLSYVSTNAPSHLPAVEKPCHSTSSLHRLANEFPGHGPSVSTISWGYNRMDVFGLSPSGIALHKWYDGYQWQPNVDGLESLGGDLFSPPIAVSRNTSRMDIFSVGSHNALYHKHYDGYQWNPTDDPWENLGGSGDLDSTLPVAVTSWAADRMDIFALGQDDDGRKIYHKYWDGSQWGPSAKGMELLGGDDEKTFASLPAAVSWGPDRVDVFAVDSRFELSHLYWDGSQWSQWETLSTPNGESIHQNPTSISWGPDRLDVFVVGADDKLWHLYWDGSQWSKWEDLGGELTGAVAASSWAVNRIDIVALGLDGQYYYKYYDGYQWNPDVGGGWYPKGGNFSSVPSTVSWSENRLDIWGIGTDKTLAHQTWYGSGWYPDSDKWETLGWNLVAYGN